MNILKNFEALFVMTLGLACAANYALDNNTSADAVAAANAPAAAIALATQATPANMQVVVVSAKRLTTGQKAQLLRTEGKATLSADNGAARTI